MFIISQSICIVVFNGLLSLAINELYVNFDDDVYVLFMNRDRNQFKILYFQHGHASIFSMRLAGRIPADFTSMDKIDTSSFHISLFKQTSVEITVYNMF